MTREDSPGKVVTMTTHEVNHTPPLSALATTPMDETANVFDERGDTPPVSAHIDTMETPSSQNGTLKAKPIRRPQRQNGSLKGPWGKNKESSLPAVKADTVKVLEMYLKRRSKSLNDAVLTREYFAQEKKRKDRTARNNTVSICSTISTDSATSEAQVHVQAQTRVETTVETTVECADSTRFSRTSVTQHSFHQAMRHPVMEDSSTMEQSADDELSSSDDDTPRSKSAPSTLRMQVKRDTKDELESKLRERENGTATLTREMYKRDSKKEPKRKRSFLDKARHIIRSPSTSRKYDDKEKEKLKEKEKERQKEEKEREKLKEKEREKEKQKEKEKLKELKERLKEEKERQKEEKEKQKEKERSTEGDEIESDTVFARNSARNEVHSEMKKTGFTARLKQTFSRPMSRKSSRDRQRDHDHPKPKVSDVQPPTDSHNNKETKSRRWPSFQFRRRSRKSASTPTDESGACGTPSDTASMDFESYISIADHTRSLNDAERRKLLMEMNRGGVVLRNSGNASDSQLLDNAPRAPVLSQASSRDSFNSFASSEGSERRPERPKSLTFRRTRAERASRGLNNVIRLDNTTPGHVRRDIGTGEAIFSVPLALVSEDLVRDGGASSRPVADGQDRDERNQTDSWTESGDGSDIPFEQRDQSEQEQFFKRIADRLAQIGDQALADYEYPSDSGGASGSGAQKATRTTCYAEAQATYSATATTGAAAPSLQDGFEAIGIRIRTDVDSIQQPRGMRQPMFPTHMVGLVVQNNKSYQTFCDAMQSIVGQEIGWEQLALVFKFTKVAVKVAHSMGKKASSIKDNSVRYIGDRFAVWLDSQGGWGSVVTSDDSDSIHEESEID